MVDIKILDRIKKLFSLSNNNSNEEEANSAMLMAQKLLVKHGLEKADIEDDGEPETVEENRTVVGKRKAYWKTRLAVIIASNFRCRIYSSPGTVVFVGMTVDVAICKEVYKAAVAYCDRFCEAFLLHKVFELGRTLDKTEAKKQASDFRLGFVSGLDAKFAQQVKENNWGLVLVIPGAVVAYYDTLSLTKGTASKQSNWGNADAFSSGKTAGSKFANQYSSTGKDRGPKLLK